MKKGLNGELPSRRECLALLRAAGVWPNIVAHSLVVERFAVRLAEKIRRRGARVDVALVSRGALLHDFDKSECLECGRDGRGKFKVKHGFRAHELLVAKGARFKKIALIARRHILESVLGRDAPRTLEEKIVFYADKRVTSLRVVSLRARLRYIMRRYGVNAAARKQIRSCEKGALRVEKELRALAGGGLGKI